MLRSSQNNETVTELSGTNFGLLESPIVRNTISA